MSRRNMLLLIATGLVSYACYVRGEQNPYPRYVAAGYSVIDRWSLEDVPDEELFEGAMRGMVAVLGKHGDEHSLFVNQEERAAFREDLTQEFGGVGVRIRLLGQPPLLTVIGPPEPGTPAFTADIRSGDRILAINGEPTQTMQLLDVLKQMRGPVGEPVVLSLVHVGQSEPIEVTLTRAVITVESILGDVRDKDNDWQFRLAQEPRIGYVQIIKFGDKTEAELTRALETITSEGVESLILDVRDNYGGALDAAVGISDLFLRAGQPIVTTRGRDGETRDRFVSTGRGRYTQIPLVVLINQNSASASEILAACLQDYGRATIIGQRTYGKGTVQRLLRVESGRSLLKLTSATYWRPSGKNIHRMPGASENDDWGVSPDKNLEAALDDDEYLQWRQYRRRRDVFGDRHDGPLVQQFDAEDGELPEEYVDRALELAVDFLVNELDGPGLPNR
ncbi:MAG: S41 family peptidase [Planctomycetes bacterium]|nr:S41 family peptidase [Planctomycetota bacterium]